MQTDLRGLRTILETHDERFALIGEQFRALESGQASVGNPVSAYSQRLRAATMTHERLCLASGLRAFRLECQRAGQLAVRNSVSARCYGRLCIRRWHKNALRVKMLGQRDARKATVSAPALPSPTDAMASDADSYGRFSEQGPARRERLLATATPRSAFGRDSGGAVRFDGKADTVRDPRYQTILLDSDAVPGDAPSNPGGLNFSTPELHRPRPKPGQQGVADTLQERLPWDAKSPLLDADERAEHGRARRRKSAPEEYRAVTPRNYGLGTDNASSTTVRTPAASGAIRTFGLVDDDLTLRVIIVPSVSQTGDDGTVICLCGNQWQELAEGDGPVVLKDALVTDSIGFTLTVPFGVDEESVSQQVRVELPKQPALRSISTMMGDDTTRYSPIRTTLSKFLPWPQGWSRPPGMAAVPDNVVLVRLHAGVPDDAARYLEMTFGPYALQQVKKAARLIVKIADEAAGVAVGAAAIDDVYSRIEDDHAQLQERRVKGELQLLLTVDPGANLRGTDAGVRRDGRSPSDRDGYDTTAGYGRRDRRDKYDRRDDSVNLKYAPIFQLETKVDKWDSKQSIQRWQVAIVRKFTEGALCTFVPALMRKAHAEGYDLFRDLRVVVTDKAVERVGQRSNLGSATSKRLLDAEGHNIRTALSRLTEADMDNTAKLCKFFSERLCHMLLIMRALLYYTDAMTMARNEVKRAISVKKAEGTDDVQFLAEYHDRLGLWTMLWGEQVTRLTADERRDLLVNVYQQLSSDVIRKDFFQACNDALLRVAHAQGVDVTELDGVRQRVRVPHGIDHGLLSNADRLNPAHVIERVNDLNMVHDVGLNYGRVNEPCLELWIIERLAARFARLGGNSILRDVLISESEVMVVGDDMQSPDPLPGSDEGDAPGSSTSLQLRMAQEQVASQLQSSASDISGLRRELRDSSRDFQEQERANEEAFRRELEAQLLGGWAHRSEM